MDPGRSLRWARRRAGLTQRALAEKSGVAQPAIARIERGTVIPRVDTLDRLLEACGYGVYVLERAGIGVDRTLIDEQRRLEPARRLQFAEDSARYYYGLRKAFGRAPGVAREPPPTHRRGIIDVLTQHGVRYVVIGGVAANLWGSPSLTLDLDICYARDPDNLDRLAAALRELGATLRGAPPGLPLQLDGRMLRHGDVFTFSTRFGSFDCLGTPSGSAGFDALDRNALDMFLDGVPVRVADVRDLIAMKRAAGRPKDLVELQILAALVERLEEDPGD